MPNILVVDDEQAITNLIEVYLKNENFTVYKFYNGTDAPELSQEYPDRPGDPGIHAAGY